MLHIPTRVSSLEWLGKWDICCECQHVGCTRIWLVLQTLWWLLRCGTWCHSRLGGCKIYRIQGTWSAWCMSWIRLSRWSVVSRQFCRSMHIFASSLSFDRLLAIIISAWVSVPFSNVAVASVLSSYCGGGKKTRSSMVGSSHLSRIQGAFQVRI
jgi:hypothetical protein